VRWCVVCDSPGIPPLSVEEYERGLGGEQRRDAYEAAREAEREQRFLDLYGSASSRQRAAIRRSLRAQIDASAAVLLTPANAEALLDARYSIR
jgi:hypothetical protein